MFKLNISPYPLIIPPLILGGDLVTFTSTRGTWKSKVFLQVYIPRYTWFAFQGKNKVYIPRYTRFALASRRLEAKLRMISGEAGRSFGRCGLWTSLPLAWTECLQCHSVWQVGYFFENLRLLLMTTTITTKTAMSMTRNRPCAETSILYICDSIDSNWLL